MAKKCLENLEGFVFDEVQEERLAEQAKALAHPVRVRLLKILASGQCFGNDLVGDLGLAQSTVSQHISVLRKAGFVDAEVRHPKTCFSLNDQALSEFKHLMAYLEG